ncbi:uncharacterized protein F4812DRAFT_454135 [Daldinia caldariorum]|uniref:uncharacterized protein n=1 Tax=Daldinia caldariorum TaxID=326644 RepID=UPI002007E406|nr:uncharacterized protein F4812DRAFT_454135 [Daldinia caldariorum]KAI1472322.1 hypothetical protein F4812DRAFT_454135 [Daldinia caldariorum]
MPGTTAPGSRWANSRLPRQPLTASMNANSSQTQVTAPPAQGAPLNNPTPADSGSHSSAYATKNAVSNSEMASMATVPANGDRSSVPDPVGSAVMGSMASTAAAQNANEKISSVEMFMNMYYAQPGPQNFSAGLPFPQAQGSAGAPLQAPVVDPSMLRHLQQYWNPANSGTWKPAGDGMRTQEDHARYVERGQPNTLQNENAAVFRQVLQNVANGLPPTSTSNSASTSPSQKGVHKRKNTTVSAPPKMTEEGSPALLRGRTMEVDVAGMSRGPGTPVVQENLVQFVTPTSTQRVGLLCRNPSNSRNNTSPTTGRTRQISPLAPAGSHSAHSSMQSIVNPNDALAGSSSDSSSANGLLEAVMRAQSATPTPQTRALIRQHHGLAKSPTSQASTLRSPSPIYGPLEFLPVPDEIRKIRSDWLNRLVGPHGQPTVEEMLHAKNMPFVETCYVAERCNNGIVCISNIPYEITRAEIIAFLGRSARILNDKEEPVHIIMDRVTSKTNDCYVEFVSFQDAVNAVDKHRAAIKLERHPKLGDRNVEMAVSSQAKLMSELFPTAHGVDWHQSPYAFTSGSEWDFENFKGFVCAEEMGMLYKHAEANSHASYAKGCPERPFECMISTIKKMPWYLTERITIKERHYIYDATFKMVQYLKELLERGAMRRGQKPDYNRLTKQLLNRLVKSAMLCPGFTVCQKDNIAYTVNLSELDLREYNQPRLASRWCHQYTLGVKPGVPLDVVKYYISLIRAETSRVVDNLAVQRKRALKLDQNKTSDYWGFFWCEMGLPSGGAFDRMTLADVAALEWDAIEKVIRRAITGGELPSY